MKCQDIVFDHIIELYLFKDRFLYKMGEAKRREELGLPPREKKIIKNKSKNKINQILNKYPFFPYILGLSLLTILIIDLINYYK